MTGQTIKQLRAARLITQRELALLAGIHEKLLDDIERGLTKLKPSLAVKLLDAIKEYSPEIS